MVPKVPVSPRGADGEQDGVHFQNLVCESCGAKFSPESRGAQEAATRGLVYGWLCDICLPAQRRRMRWGPHCVALVVTLPFGIWITQLERADFLPQTAWLLPLAAAYYLGLRIGRELVKGWLRWRGRTG